MTLNDSDSDINAIKKYLALGHSRKETYDAFCSVFSQASDNINRYKTLKKFIMETDFEIEKGVEMPKQYYGKKRKYHFAEMEIGDSFLFSKEVDRRTQSRAYTACYMWKEHNSNPEYKKRKYATRVTEDGMRIWRVK